MAKTFDFKKVAVIVAGVPVQGFIDGDAIVVAKNSDAWELTVGVDGESTRSRSNNESGRITLRLQGSSLSNAYLDGLRTGDELSGLGQVPIMIKDLFGTLLVNAAQCWCVKVPDVTLSRTPGQREWVFESGNIAMAGGGNV